MAFVAPFFEHGAGGEIAKHAVGTAHKNPVYVRKLGSNQGGIFGDDFCGHGEEGMGGIEKEQLDR